MTQTSGPLAGTRVIDLTAVLMGPSATQYLADLGADVVKVEPPEGDTTRGVPPFVDGVSVYYAQMNAGKRNVCIDLKAPGGPALVERLARSVDVLIENFRPGVLERFGLDAPRRFQILRIWHAVRNDRRLKRHNCSVVGTRFRHFR